MKNSLNPDSDMGKLLKYSTFGTMGEWSIPTPYWFGCVNLDNKNIMSIKLLINIHSIIAWSRGDTT